MINSIFAMKIRNDAPSVTSLVIGHGDESCMYPKTHFDGMASIELGAVALLGHGHGWKLHGHGSTLVPEHSQILCI